MLCQFGRRFSRLALYGLAPLLAACLVGCPLGDNTGDSGGGMNGGGTTDPDPGGTRQLPITIDPPTGGTVTQSASGSLQTLTAVPADGWEFVRWLGTTNSTNNPLIIQVSDDTDISAEFRFIQPDADGDGVPNIDDVCPGFDDNIDTDLDGVPDGCDRCPGGDDGDDADGDGKPDECDGCPNTATDDDTADADDDGIPDGCDACPEDANNDADGDGVCEPDDECPDTEADTIVDELGCPRPENDLCEKAMGVSDEDTTFNIEHASTDDLGSSPTCSADADDPVINDPTNDIWFCYTATCSGNAVAGTCDSTELDTVMAVYSGCGCLPAELIACGDDQCGDDAQATFTVIEGQEYMIRLGGFNGATGTGTLSISCGCTSDTDCNDGNACNGAETCDTATGDCQDGTPLSCGDDGLFCNGTEGGCDTATGCQLGTPVNCDDGIGCTVDSCNENTDTCEHVPNNSNCPDDGLFCNGTEFCDAMNDCSSSGNPCDEGEPCDEENDVCLDPCTSDAECDDGDICTNDVCSDTTGQCEHPFNTSACDDGDPCTTVDVCSQGQCQGSVPPDCASFDTVCHIARCDANGTDGNCDTLLEQLDGTICDDGDGCTENDSCSSGQCGGVPIDCSLLDSDCTVGCCVNNECVASPANENFSCDDGNTCTALDICSLGTCTGTPLEGCRPCENDLDCFDGIACTVDRCGTFLDTCVEGFLDDSVCDDGSLCTDDFCDPLIGDPTTGCVNEVAVTCGENEQCNPVSGECEPIPCTGDEECDDGTECTTDACVEQACVFTTVVCDDASPCTIDSCDTTTGCNFEPVDCFDGVECTVDSCEEITGACLNTPDHEFCNDDTFCNGNESCDVELGCRPGAAQCPGQDCVESPPTCVPTETTWDSTQMLLPFASGFDPPQRYDFNSVGSLISADLGLTLASLQNAFSGADVTLITSVVAPGVDTLLYQVIASGLTRLSVRIDTFELSFADVGGSTIATWDFDYTFTKLTSDIFDTSESSRFVGTQSGTLDPGGLSITWSQAQGIMQSSCDPDNATMLCPGFCDTSLSFCTVGPLFGQTCTTNADCEQQLENTGFLPGTWDKQ